MKKRGSAPLLALAVVVSGLLMVGIPGLWLYMKHTATPLHPKATEVPSVPESSPKAKWARAVEEARQIARAHLTGKNLPGLSVAVGVGGEVVWAEGFGFADLQTSTPVTPKHRFRIGTASTVLTSAAAGLLLQQGKLNLDDEVQKYVPEFPRKQWPVTLRQVMAHTAGLESDGGDESSLYGQHCERPVEALPHFADEPLRFEPGTDYRYSNYGWIVVSAAIEAAAGQPFLTFLRDKVLDPLGLRDTLADSAPLEPDDDHPLVNFFTEMIHDPRTKRRPIPEGAKKPIPNRVTSYFPRFAAEPEYGLHLMRPLNLSCYAGAGAFVSTPSDLVRFAMALSGGKLLDHGTVQLLQTSQTVRSGKDTGYGLGWQTMTVNVAGRDTRTAGANGRVLGGIAASLQVFPEHGITVAVISNISYSDTFSLAVKIGGAFGKE